MKYIITRPNKFKEMVFFLLFLLGNNRIVPVLIPKDTFKGMEILSDAGK